MRTSESIKEIAKAMHNAQAEMNGAKKDSQNPFFKSSYSDLTSIMQAISVPFADSGLSFVQGAEYQDGMIAIVTRIMHLSGEWIESTTILPAVKNDPQAYGSAITYGKRYGLQALAGVPSVDDDAQYASASARAASEASDLLIEKYVTNMLSIIEKADSPGARQLWDEMTKPEQDSLWKKLKTKEKAVVRSLLHIGVESE